MWRNGVRDLDAQTYASITALAGGPQEDTGTPNKPTTPTEPDDLVAPAAKIVAGASRGGFRLSKRAKEIGDWAELAAMTFIETLGATEITHRAARGETPGWDINYVDGDGAQQRVSRA